MAKNYKNKRKETAKLENIRERGKKGRAGLRNKGLYSASDLNTIIFVVARKMIGDEKNLLSGKR